MFQLFENTDYKHFISELKEKYCVCKNWAGELNASTLKVASNEFKLKGLAINYLKMKEAIKDAESCEEVFQRFKRTNNNIASDSDVEEGARAAFAAAADPDNPESPLNPSNGMGLGKKLAIGGGGGLVTGLIGGAIVVGVGAATLGVGLVVGGIVGLFAGLFGGWWS